MEAIVKFVVLRLAPDTSLVHRVTYRGEAVEVIYHDIHTPSPDVDLLVDFVQTNNAIGLYAKSPALWKWFDTVPLGKILQSNQSWSRPDYRIEHVPRRQFKN